MGTSGGSGPFTTQSTTEIKIPGIIGGSYTTIEGSEFEVTGQIQASKDISADTKMILVLKREGESDLEKGMTLEISLRSAFSEYHVILGMAF